MFHLSSFQLYFQGKRTFSFNCFLNDLILTFVRLTVWNFHHRLFVFICSVSVLELFFSLLIQDFKHLSMNVKFHLDVNQSWKANNRQKYRWNHHRVRDWTSLSFLHHSVLRGSRIFQWMKVYLICMQKVRLVPSRSKYVVTPELTLGWPSGPVSA